MYLCVFLYRFYDLKILFTRNFFKTKYKIIHDSLIIFLNFLTKKKKNEIVDYFKYLDAFLTAEGPDLLITRGSMIVHFCV